MESAAIVLAAGAGTRMKSRKPKVAHEVLGKPMVRWVVDAAREAGLSRIVTVVGHERDQVIPLVEADTQIAEQYVRRGTADAVNSCREQFGSHGESAGKDRIREIVGVCRHSRPQGGGGVKWKLPGVVPDFRKRHQDVVQEFGRG